MKDFYKSKSPLFVPVPRPVNDRLPGKVRKQDIKNPKDAGDQTANRFRDLDELRFSMRSVAENAGHLFRKIHLLTTEVVEDREDGSQVRYGQAPRWLKQRTAGPSKNSEDIDDRVELVLHRDIFDNPDNLPSFNSLAIESQMHHVPGLADIVSFSVLQSDLTLMNRSKRSRSRLVDLFFFHDNYLCATKESWEQQMEAKMNGSTKSTEVPSIACSQLFFFFLTSCPLASSLHT